MKYNSQTNQMLKDEIKKNSILKNQPKRKI